MMHTKETHIIHIEGLVQGVGFRPFVYRLAKRYGICGTVENSNDGVWINAQRKQRNESTDIELFIDAICNEAPPAAKVGRVEKKLRQRPEYKDFTIASSRDISAEITQVSPDIAVCEDCLRDMKEQSNRLDYPFVNCTNCGPRFSIITGLPYDRDNTTMHVFTMCSSCRREYKDVNDRRFHAQPVACADCGPHYSLWQGKEEMEELPKILKMVAGILTEGGMVAIKGIGGYFLSCDAQNPKAVQRLRNVKLREGKPFAVMFRDLKAVKNYAVLSQWEEEELVSWRRPIVLLQAEGGKKLAEEVTSGFHTIGALLPYMPFHYLLFEHIDLPALVLTSGNLLDEPILIDDREALHKLGRVADAVLTYNREIHNRVDDSVVFFSKKFRRMIRRSRGFVPAPQYLPFDADGILAVGAELMNCFCLGKGKQAIMSQHIGDLKNFETYQFFVESIGRFKTLFRVDPRQVVCDLHPDYLSTRYAMETGLPVVQVQHHHAHVAAVMAEHALDEPVIGVSLDGTGLGDDGHIWGGEFLVCDYRDYQRMAHIAYAPMPGGDKAALQPWRMALAYLYEIYGRNLESVNLPVVEKAKREKTIFPVMQMIEKKINTPLTSSMGRLFDAVAALTGICMDSGFHAEAPMRLEAMASSSETGSYSWKPGKLIIVLPMIEEIVRDMKHKVSPGVIAAKFHHTIADIVVTMAGDLRQNTGIDRVVLSGGTFQNRRLLEESEQRLEQLGFHVFRPVEFPVNDGGIALGQLAILAAGRK